MDIFQASSDSRLVVQNRFGVLLLAFFLAAFFVYHFGLVSDVGLFRDQVSFITDIALFNLVHIIFTFLGLLFIKEMRAWHRKVYSETSFIGFGLLATFGIVAIIYIFFFDDSAPWHFSRFALRAYGLHHSVMQTYGIYLLSGSSLLKSKQKKWFLGISATYALVLAAVFLLPDGAKNVITYPCFFLCCVCVFKILNLNKNNRAELLFLSRLIAYPIGIFSPIMALAIAAFHGVEYIIFFRQLSKRSSSAGEIFKISSKSFLIFVGVLIYSALCFVNLRNESFGIAHPSYYNQFEASSSWMIFWWFMDSCNILHYLYDSILFRVSNKESRDYILPLIAERRVKDSIVNSMK